jgi:DNA invertase Pin-like site-specific DNA recombinase
LSEQKAAIERYAARFALPVSDWFEEQQTAAKRGRPVWTNMLKMLRNGHVSGVIMHKIDRSARNLKDWADLGEIIDRGVEVHFANESLDLNSRGGRLSADIQAVVAADFIRNLREEAKKGIYGRLKQGFLPSAAPVGYLDHGGGKQKTIDPEKGPLVRKAFLLYATGSHTLFTLGDELNRMGLRNRAGGRITRNGLSMMLNNPFYIGIIRLRGNGQTFQGNHEPLISKRLFDQVHNALTGHFNARTNTHELLFRKSVRCKGCGYSLIGEVQKGHVYYRCHTKDCAGASIREETIDERIGMELQKLRFSDEEYKCLIDELKEQKENWTENREQEFAALNAKCQQVTERLSRLTDAFLDGSVERDLYDERKKALLFERSALNDRLKDLSENPSALPVRLQKFLELTEAAYSLYKDGNPDEKRRMVKMFTSNLTADHKNLDFAFSIPFTEVANRDKNTSGSPLKGLHRTLRDLVNSLAVKIEALPFLRDVAAGDDFLN